MAKALAGDIIADLDLTPEEFSYPNPDSAKLQSLVSRAIVTASTKTQAAVGAANYASADTVIAANLKLAETSLACAIMLRRRLIILSSRPEEAPPPEYTHLDVLTEEIARYERDWKEAIEPYQTQDFGAAGTGFAFGSYGLDENANDDWDYMDEGDLPSS